MLEESECSQNNVVIFPLPSVSDYMVKIGQIQSQECFQI